MRSLTFYDFLRVILSFKTPTIKGTIIIIYWNGLQLTYIQEKGGQFGGESSQHHFRAFQVGIGSSLYSVVFSYQILDLFIPFKNKKM